MASRLELYNQSLLRLGERRLATLSDNRPERRSLDAVWADTLAYMIEAAMWNFASRTEELQASETVTPNFGYTYAVEKPDDYVRIVNIADNELMAPTLQDFMEEGDYFLTWCDPLYLQYISNDTSYGADPGKWTASFSRAFVLELAYRIAPQIGYGDEKQKGQDARKYQEDQPPPQPGNGNASKTIGGHIRRSSIARGTQPRRKPPVPADSKVRREGDSNPQALARGGFQDRCLTNSAQPSTPGEPHP